MSEATLRATSKRVRLSGDEFLASEIEQAANDIAKLERELAEKEQRILDLESALRLHLAVAVDDPILINPVERELAKYKDVAEAAKRHVREISLSYQDGNLVAAVRALKDDKP